MRPPRMVPVMVGVFALFGLSYLLTGTRYLVRWELAAIVPAAVMFYLSYGSVRLAVSSFRGERGAWWRMMGLSLLTLALALHAWDGGIERTFTALAAIAVVLYILRPSVRRYFSGHR